MELLTAGLNHTTADVALRERVSLTGAALDAALRELRGEPGVREVAVLSTCNRTEIYCLSEGPVPDLAGWLARHKQMSESTLRRAMYQYRAHDALRHMMRVAGGLDSLVLGEPQILGQMRDAYSRAHDSGVLGTHLARYFQQTFAVAKRIRTDTGIGTHPVSVAYAAVSFARHIFADLSKSRALLIGAGEMISLVARHLKEQQVADIVVANRTLARAQVLAEEVNGRAITLEELPGALEHADIVISCTASPVPVLGKGVVERALKKRRHRPIFMVDIAVPRDIEPEVGKLGDIYLYTVDDLHEAIESNVRQRREAAREAERLIEEALLRHERESRELTAVDTVRAYREKIQLHAGSELQRAMRQLEAGQDPTEVMQRFQQSLVNKILHAPSVQLRRLAAERREDALRVAREILLDEPVADESPARQPEE
ncbi:MAG: glutamyl-tRNA reductase [Alcanivoracaceae bacterium]